MNAKDRFVLTMIVGRIVYAGSKLSLSNQWKNTALWELCGVGGPVDVEEHCYEPMDRLLQRQQAIERTLAHKHLQDAQVVLYDITSTYFEGAYAGSQIVLFGYNRDRKQGHEQVVLGLLCNAQGCPIGVEGLHAISAQTHRQIVKLVERKVIQPELFDEKRIAEVVDPDKPEQRYCLCRNPQSGARQRSTRQRLLDRTLKALDKIVARKKKGSTEKLSAQVGKILARNKTGKFVQWQIQEGRLQWHLDQERIEKEKLFDGCYIISATVPTEQMNHDQVVRTYKSLSMVEQAFGNLKTVSLEVRPVFHKKDDRIRSHVFLCVLAFYLQWHLQQRLRPLLEADGEGKNRQWTVENVIERLKAIRKQRIKVGDVEFAQVTQADEEQQRILDLLRKKP